MVQSCDSIDMSTKLSFWRASVLVFCVRVNERGGAQDSEIERWWWTLAVGDPSQQHIDDESCKFVAELPAVSHFNPVAIAMQSCRDDFRARVALALAQIEPEHSDQASEWAPNRAILRAAPSGVRPPNCTILASRPKSWTWFQCAP